MTDSIPQQAGPGAGADEQLRSALAALVSDPIVQGMSARISNQANEDGRPDPLAVARAALAVEDSREREVLVLLIGHDGDDSPSVALARNRVELLEQVKVAVWGEPHPADTTNDAGDDMAEGITDTLLETGVMTFEGDPPLRLVRIPVDGWFAAMAAASSGKEKME